MLMIFYIVPTKVGERRILMNERILRETKIWKIFIVSSTLGIIGGVLDTVFDLTLAKVPQMVLDHQDLIPTLIFLGLLLVVN